MSNEAKIEHIKGLLFAVLKLANELGVEIECDPMDYYGKEITALYERQDREDRFEFNVKS